MKSIQRDIYREHLHYINAPRLANASAARFIYQRKKDPCSVMITSQEQILTNSCLTISILDINYCHLCYIHVLVFFVQDAIF